MRINRRGCPIKITDITFEGIVKAINIKTVKITKSIPALIPRLETKKPYINEEATSEVNDMIDIFVGIFASAFFFKAVRHAFPIPVAVEYHKR